MTLVGETPAQHQSLLQATAVRFSFGDRLILNGVDLSLFPGQLCALVGGNGSGKSTLVNVLLGLYQPAAGTVQLRMPPPVIGYVPQRTRLDGDVPASLAEVVGIGLLQSRISRGERTTRVAEALAAVGLDDRANDRVGQLSGGQQQRVLIARAIVRRPDLLVLDEPVAGVDAASQQAFHDILAAQLQRGASVLLVSHELSAVADLVNRVVVLRHARVDFDGPPDELARQGISLGVHDHDLPVWLERT
jgi:zinc transport system ATP-binding protein